jgi:PhnB protein
MKQANPYLNFAGNTEEAFNFYRSIFGGEFLALVRFREFGENPMGIPEDELDRIAHIALPLGGGNVLMATDTTSGQPRTVGSNVYIALEADTAEEAGRLFSGLAAGGRTEMELQQTQWAEKYGSLVDRYGVQWMVSYTGNVKFRG